MSEIIRHNSSYSASIAMATYCFNLAAILAVSVMHSSSRVITRDQQAKIAGPLTNMSSATNLSLRSGAILGEGECLNFRRSRKKREPFFRLSYFFAFLSRPSKTKTLTIPQNSAATQATLIFVFGFTVPSQGIVPVSMMEFTVYVTAEDDDVRDYFGSTYYCDRRR